MTTAERLSADEAGACPALAWVTRTFASTEPSLLSVAVTLSPEPPFDLFEIGRQGGRPFLSTRVGRAALTDLGRMLDACTALPVSGMDLHLEAEPVPQDVLLMERAFIAISANCKDLRGLCMFVRTALPFVPDSFAAVCTFAYGRPEVLPPCSCAYAARVRGVRPSTHRCGSAVRSLTLAQSRFPFIRSPGLDTRRLRMRRIRGFIDSGLPVIARSVASEIKPNDSWKLLLHCWLCPNARLWLH